MGKKINVYGPSKPSPWWTVGWALLVLAVCFGSALLGGCSVAGTGAPECPASGCVVATGHEEPRYVPQCQDADGIGPCVGQVGTSGMWLYVSYGYAWPDGGGNGTLIPGVRTVELCPNEDGGPVPCAWVPSVQGNGTGDSGALVYGVR